jgi:hypothetical protein
MMFGMLDNYHSEFLCFEVVQFNCAYNAIIEGPELAKFMVIPHYSYMMLNMLGSQGIITMKADFQASMECYRGAIQTSLSSSTSVAQKRLIAEADTLSKDDLSILVLEATPTWTCGRSRRLRRPILASWMCARRRSTTLASPTNRKMRSSDSYKVTGMCFHRSLQTC